MREYDLNLLNGEIAQPCCLSCANQQGIGSSFTQGQAAGMLDNLKKILAQKNLAATERQGQHTCIGHFVDQAENLGVVISPWS